ncbi:ATP-dependent zinc metalloprotease FtsH [Micavibrio aeruginosavorus]|uniref:ATP-dependent zinc metalloprotease FtsH n=1 Tax=Micavibrio aeruginosavorus (strain ARL-13) TaxID=856793 RepID=G2KNX4_MICAA|nr:ATP-dependent zinc metalloprotease FtsH [Micavibrio aeruginosavorus]AEP10769.1 ATP-dependent metallopeptidase HflB family protein [Micavibrio aeruginosavorus ARL-13]
MSNMLIKVGLTALFVAVAYNMMDTKADDQAARPKAEHKPYTQFIDMALRGDFEEIELRGQDGREVRALDGNGTLIVSRIPVNENIMNRLYGERVDVVDLSARDKPQEAGFMSRLFLTLLPAALMIGFFMFMMRGGMKGPGGGGGGGLLSGKSMVKKFNARDCDVRFEDVAGIDEAKSELMEMVDFLKHPGKYTRLGAKIPRGALLVGPPGTGKTLMAKAVAGEAGVPFLSQSGSEFVEMFVGRGAARVRELFEEAKKSAPCIIFIDEIDAVGRQRGGGVGGGNDEREQTLNQLLVEMDGFDGTEGIIILAATNRADILDAALKRPGRFDRQVHVGLPDLSGRVRILETHLRNKPIAPDVDVKVIARGVPGFSGADLANLANEAALFAARRGDNAITQADFEGAADRIMMGAERKTMIMTEQEKRLTAYHEAGHALCAIHAPGADPIHKATIIPRGGALGMVMQLPEGDRVSLTRQQAHARLAVCYGGRVAEEMIFGADKVTTGASGDIQSATAMARAMVEEWGLSDKAGAVLYSSSRQEQAMGATGRSRSISEVTSLMLDQEIRELTDMGKVMAEQILTDHRGQLENIAEALLKYETLSGSEIKIVANGGVLTRDPSQPAPDETPKGPGTFGDTPANDGGNDMRPPKPL